MTKTILIAAWLLTAVLPCLAQETISVTVWQDGQKYVFQKADSVSVDGAKPPTWKLQDLFWDLAPTPPVKPYKPKSPFSVIPGLGIGRGLRVSAGLGYLNWGFHLETGRDGLEFKTTYRIEL